MYLGRLDGWTLFITVGLRCIFQFIFETVYQHEKTKPLKNGMKGQSENVALS
jgi:hypothetical protein